MSALANRKWEIVPRANIEAPARMGYLDRLAGRGYDEAYATAPPPWQRNYEAGRLWASGMMAAGIEAPDWPEDQARQPAAIDWALAEVRSRIGPSRPEDYGRQAADPGLNFRNVLPRERVSRRR